MSTKYRKRTQGSPNQVGNTFKIQDGAVNVSGGVLCPFCGKAHRPGSSVEARHLAKFNTGKRKYDSKLRKNVSQVGDEPRVKAPKTHKELKSPRAVLSTITSIAKDARINHSRWVSSGQVRGFGSSTSGYETSELKDYDGLDAKNIYITYRAGSSFSRSTPEGQLRSYTGQQEQLLKFVPGLQQKGIVHEVVRTSEDVGDGTKKEFVTSIKIPVEKNIARYPVNIPGYVPSDAHIKEATEVVNGRITVTQALAKGGYVKHNIVKGDTGLVYTSHSYEPSSLHGKEYERHVKYIQKRDEQNRRANTLPSDVTTEELVAAFKESGFANHLTTSQVREFSNYYISHRKGDEQ